MGGSEVQHRHGGLAPASELSSCKKLTFGSQGGTGGGSGGRRWFSIPPLGCLEGRKEDSKQMGESQYLFDIGSRCGVTIIPTFLYIRIFLILLICLENSRESCHFAKPV